MAKPSYSTNDPKGWGGDPGRGAALGRPEIHTDGFSGELTLKRIMLDSGGYDPNGTYFGAGLPLYWFASEGGEVDAMLRARDRASVIEAIGKVYPEATIPLDDSANWIDEFFSAYVTAALWSTSDNSDESGGDPLDKNYSIDDLAPECRAKLREACGTFHAANVELLSRARYANRRECTDAEMAGHDFWLTSNGHGAGFQDGDVQPREVGKALADAARKARGFDLYVGDDGKIYC